MIALDRLTPEDQGLLEQIRRLEEARSIHDGKGRWQHRAPETLIRSLLTTTDETVMPRVLTARSSCGRSLQLGVANGRVHRLGSQLADSPVEKTDLSHGGDREVTVLAHAIRELARDCDALSLSVEFDEAPDLAQGGGVAVGALRDALQVSVRGATPSSPDDLLHGMLERFAFIEAYCLHAEDAASGGGENEAGLAHLLHSLQEASDPHTRIVPGQSQDAECIMMNCPWDSRSRVAIALISDSVFGVVVPAQHAEDTFDHLRMACLGVAP